MTTATLPALDLDTSALDAILGALASRPSALVSVADLGAVLGMGDDDAQDVCAELEAAGLLSTFEGDDDAPMLVILSSLAAEMLSLDLDCADDSQLNSCRWIARGTGKPPRPSRNKVRTRNASDVFDPDGPGLDGLADTNNPPPGERKHHPLAENADPGMRRETPAGKAQTFLDRLPYPRLLIGVNAIWPVADVGGRCGACLGRMPEGVPALCLCCHSASYDGWLPPIVLTPDQVREEERRRERQENRRAKGESKPGKAPKPAKVKALAGGSGQAEGRALKVKAEAKSKPRKAQDVARLRKLRAKEKGAA